MKQIVASFCTCAFLVTTPLNRCMPEKEVIARPADAVTSPGAMYTGNDWLAMDKTARLSYVIGYLVGRSDGQGSGCTIAFNSVEKSPQAASMGHELLVQLRERCGPEALRQFGKPPEFYEGLMTKFYTQYPDISDFPYTSIMGQLADSTNVDKTPEGLHKSFRVEKR